MSIPNLKKMPMTKEEVSILIDLVAANKAVISKETNAVSNKLKEGSWLEITRRFNSMVKSGPRKQEQLRLKWKNLKKAARKRTSKAQGMYIKTGEYGRVSPDELLDKVDSLLAKIDDPSMTADGSTNGGSKYCNIPIIEVDLTKNGPVPITRKKRKLNAAEQNLLNVKSEKNSDSDTNEDEDDNYEELRTMQKFKEAQEAGLFNQNFLSSDEDSLSDLKEKEDPKRMFLLSLLPEIEEMNNKQMRMFKRKVFDLIDEIIESGKQHNERMLPEPKLMIPENFSVANLCQVSVEPGSP